MGAPRCTGSFAPICQLSQDNAAKTSAVAGGGCQAARSQPGRHHACSIFDVLQQKTEIQRAVWLGCVPDGVFEGIFNMVMAHQCGEPHGASKARSRSRAPLGELIEKDRGDFRIAAKGFCENGIAISAKASIVLLA
jgi:hypothetical protein